MDRSLWLLLWLRVHSWIRRLSRALRTVKGALLVLAGGMVFVPMLMGFLVVPRAHSPEHTAMVLRHGSLGMLAFCLVNVFFTTGERAIYYSPAEVGFLFSGPFRPRQILVYKIIGMVGSGLLALPFLTLALAQHANNLGSACVGLFLGMQFLSLFSLAFALAASTASALAFSHARKAILVGLVAVVLLGLSLAGRGPVVETPKGRFDSFLESPGVRVARLPFEPFVRTFAAERLWPDLVGWAALALALDVGLAGLVIGLNAQFLEASAAASNKIHERLLRARRGAWAVRPSKSRLTVPPLAWSGGIGPNLWRQLVTASRSLVKVGSVLALFLFPVLLLLGISLWEGKGLPDPGPLVGSLVGLAFFVPTTIGFDFRADIDRLEDLKALPIPPIPLVLGQVAAPVLIVTLSEWLSLALMAGLSNQDPRIFLAVGLLLFPFNLIMILIENLYFLWFPYRMAAANTFDFQAMGRQFLLVTTKFTTISVICAIAVGVGALVHLVTGGNWPAIVAAGWLVVLAFGLSLVPLVALAFERFDVARTPPE